MATQHGSLREFHPESDTIKAYLERTSLYFSANDVPDAKKVAVLLSTIGVPTYSLLSDLVAPDPPGEKSLAEIVEALCRHFEPKRTVIAERFHFHKRDQATGEGVHGGLRRSAQETRDPLQLRRHARRHTPRSVCVRPMFGGDATSIDLEERAVLYRKAMDVALAMEAAERETKALKPAASTIHKFASQDSRRKERSSCYRCGRSNHGPADCRFREADCRNCGKKGHIAPVCRSKRRTTSPTQPKPQRSRNRKQFRSTHQVPRSRNDVY